MLWKTIARKMIVLFFCLLMLSGCVTSQDGTSVPTSANITQPIGNQSTDSQPTSSQAPTLDYHIPTVDENYWELLCENCDIVRYLENTRENFLMFPFVSAQDLTGKIMTIITDQGVCMEMEVYKEANDPYSFPLGVFLMYQDIDWTALEDGGNVYSILGDYPSKYRAVASELPELYYTRIFLPLDWLGIDAEAAEPQQIRTLTVTIDGQTKTYDLGKVLLIPGRVSETKISGGGLYNHSPLISGYSTSASKEGILKLPSCDYTVKEDVVLCGISLPGSEDVTVVSCDVIITTPFGDSFNMTWDANSPIEVDAGSEIRVELTLSDPALGNTLIANVQRYISLDYMSAGESYCALVYVSCRVLVDPLAIYAMKVDGVDMLPYYLEYKTYIG